jgi:adenylate cyclase
MTPALQVRVYDKQLLVFSEEFDGPVELGRQSESREGLYSTRYESGRWRVVIAASDEDAVSRRHALLEPIGPQCFRLTNASTMIPLRLQGGIELAPKASSEVALPALLAIGRRTIRVQAADSGGLSLQGLAEATIAPGHLRPARGLPGLELSRGGGIEVEALVSWFQAIIDVLQTAASSSEFFERAAAAVVEIVGLDSGQVLLLDPQRQDWRVAAEQLATKAPGQPGARPSRQVLERLRREKRTLWHEPDQSGLQAEGASLIGLNAVVAAPILNRQGDVIGALYGERRQGSGLANLPRIMKVDAMLVELLASGVATGLARLEQEEAAVAARVQFEQFFTPALARELALRPDLLRGRNLEVTLLFCDIRGFSRISERLGPEGTVAWISDVMEVLSDCVLAHRGVLVDYIGDELIAMWGAPQEEPEHPRLACRAALEMLDRLPKLNEHWHPTLHEPMALGIGINTGIAQVGNTGTSRKFKYGALGNVVNLASRVEGATKYLRTTLVITGTTQSHLDGSFATRRLCKAAMVNIAEPVDLYELASPGESPRPGFASAYERALSDFESKNFGAAIHILGNLLAERPDDGPSLILLSRAVGWMLEEGTAFDPVWKLPGK